MLLHTTCTIQQGPRLSEMHFQTCFCASLSVFPSLFMYAVVCFSLPYTSLCLFVSFPHRHTDLLLLHCSRL